VSPPIEPADTRWFFTRLNLHTFPLAGVLDLWTCSSRYPYQHLYNLTLTPSPSPSLSLSYSTHTRRSLIRRRGRLCYFRPAHLTPPSSASPLILQSPPRSSIAWHAVAALACVLPLWHVRLRGPAIFTDQIPDIWNYPRLRWCSQNESP
jgi:hypothetical protein